MSHRQAHYLSFDACVKMSARVQFRLFDFVYNLKLFNLLCFIGGFTAGTFLIFSFYFNHKDTFHALRLKLNDEHDALYEQNLADRLFNEVRILCWVFTIPENHKTKAWSVKNTWGKRCNKLIFMSTEDDPELGAIAMPVEEGRGHLWNKTMNAIRYVKPLSQHVQGLILSSTGSQASPQ